jgi:hypothetical protein
MMKKRAEFTPVHTLVIIEDDPQVFRGAPLVEVGAARPVLLQINGGQHLQFSKSSKVDAVFQNLLGDTGSADLVMSTAVKLTEIKIDNSLPEIISLVK